MPESDQSMQEDPPACYECGNPVAGDVTGTLWCVVCGKRQPEALDLPERTVFEIALDNARARARAKGRPQ